MKATLTRIVDRHSTEASREVRATKVDEETAARLRALGYIIQPEA